MFYYRYDDNYKIVQKSSEPLTGERVAICTNDLDIELVDVIISYMDDNNYIYKYSIIQRKDSTMYDAVIKMVHKLDEMQDQQLITSIDIDYRLCLIELGLI